MFSERLRHGAGRCLQTLRWFNGKLGRRALVAAMLGIHVGLLAWISTAWSPTYDEPAHLTAGIRFWKTGHSDLDRGNPPLFRSVAALPVLLAKPAVNWQSVPYTVQSGEDFLAANGSRSFWLITLGRWALIPFSVAGGYICYRWAREWYGYGAGLTALVLWCFSPNIIANGPLITGDLVATSMGIVAFYMFWRWLSAPSWSKAAWVGILWGLAELSKFVWVMLYPLWPVMWLIWRWLYRREPGRPSWFHEAAQLVVMGLLSVWVINLGYGFEDSLHRFQRASSIDWRAERAIEGVRVSRSGLAGVVRSLPVPLPKNYVDGMGEIQNRLDVKMTTYLRGEHRPGGYWYYYLYAIFVKEPMGTLLLVALATVLAVASGNYRTDWRREAFLLLSLAAVFGVISMAGVKQRLRYALPVFPFLFLWTSRTGRAWANRQQALGVLATGCLLWSVINSLAVYPHCLSYFNELTGGPENGHWHLIEANIDWGQDLWYLKKWLDAHPEARPLHFAYLGTVDPRLAGIEFSLPPADGPRPGWHAVSVQLLKQSSRAVHDGRGGKGRAGKERYGYFWDLKPAAMAGYSIYIYHVTLEEANQVRAENRMPLLRSAQGGGEPKKDGTLPALEWLKKMLVQPRGGKKTS